MRRIWLLLLFPVCLPAAATAQPQRTLAAGGKTSYVIALPPMPTAPERTAASELQAALRTSTGAAFPIVRDGAARAAGGRIWLGQSAAVRRLLPRTEWAKLGTDGIVLRTVGRDLVLTGGRPRGVLYAVYEFLETVVGCRWWDEATTLTPRHETLPLPQLSTTYVPRIVCREPHFYLPNNDGVWAARNRANGHFHPVPPAYGGHMSILGWCHTFYQLIPPDRYFAAHPDWFSEIGGQRRADGAQLCLANDEMRRELVRNALGWIRKDPSAGFISIAQNDWGGRCECERCRAAEAEEGSPSGPLVRFVNAVAADIEKQYPGFRVETLAYQYTRKAPRVTRPRRNVTVRLCSIECDYGLPLSNPRNKAFLDDLEAWSAIAPQLFIWNYIASFGDYYYPNPTLSAYGPNIRAFADHHAVGVFMQGDSYNAASCFARLRAWVLARLLWNPARDEGKLVDEFLRGYYGAAAPALHQYLGLVEAAYARRKNADWMTPADVLAGFALFREAEAAVAGQPALLQRVRRERLPLEYLWATRHRAMVRAARDGGGPMPAPESQLDAIAAFREALIGSRSLYRAEGQLAAPWIDTWLQQLRARPAGPPAEVGAVSRDRYEDFQEQDFRLFGSGDWVTLVDDPAASNGKAARLATHHTQWAVQAPLDSVAPGRYHVYYAVRAEAADPEATAVTFGIYDNAGNAGVVSHEVKAGEIAGSRYHLLDAGVVDITPSMYAWLAPAANPQKVQAVWVDRVFLLRP